MLLLGAGCFSPSAESLARLKALEAEGDALTHSADVVEERLLGNQAMLQTWAEMQRRHGQVSELACHNQDGHLQSMVRYLSAQENKAQGLDMGLSSVVARAKSHPTAAR